MRELLFVLEIYTIKIASHFCRDDYLEFRFFLIWQTLYFASQ